MSRNALAPKEIGLLNGSAYAGPTNALGAFLRYAGNNVHIPLPPAPEADPATWKGDWMARAQEYDRSTPPPPPMWADQLPKSHPNYNSRMMTQNPEFEAFHARRRAELERLYPGWTRESEAAMRALRGALEQGAIPGLDTRPIQNPLPMDRR